MNEIKITHLKPNSQKTETWIAMIENEIVGHIFMEKEVGNMMITDEKVYLECYGTQDGIMFQNNIQVILFMLGVKKILFHSLKKRVLKLVRYVPMLRRLFNLLILI
jgi:hypothetical protein